MEALSAFVAIVAIITATVLVSRHVFRNGIRDGLGRPISYIGGFFGGLVTFTGLTFLAGFIGAIGADTKTMPSTAAPVTPIEGTAPSPRVEPVDELAMAATPTPRPTPRTKPKPTLKPTPKPTAADPWAEKRMEIERGPDFGISHAQFVRRFNGNLAKLDMGTRLSVEVTKAKMAQDSFQGSLTERLAVSGTTKISNGLVTSASLIGQGDGTENSGAAIMLAAAVLFASASADGHPRDGLKTVSLLAERAQRNDGQAKLRVGNVTYHYALIDGIGAMFTIEPH